MSKETLKARNTYQDFFILWKDAAPDIPILKQAKAEYAHWKPARKRTTQKTILPKTALLLALMFKRSAIRKSQSFS